MEIQTMLPFDHMRERPIELNTSGTVLNPTELGKHRMREQEAAKIAKKRERTPSGVVEQGEAEPVATRMARLLVTDYQMGSPEADHTLHRLVDQAKEDYLRHNTHPELDIVTSPVFFEKTVDFIRGNLVKLIGSREEPVEPARAYLNIQKAFDEAIRRALREKERNQSN